MKISRSVTALMTVLFLVYGCSGSGSRDDTHNGLLTAEEYRLALKEDADEFTWPEVYSPDIDAIAARTSSPDALIADDGATTNMLELFNMCIWYVTWNDGFTKGDSAAQREAMTVMQTTIPEYAKDEQQRAYFLDIATDAELGDPSGVQSIITNTCEPLDWIEGRE